MDSRQIGLGILLFLVFWAFQTGSMDFLGTAGWFIGILIFTGILWAVGKAAMPKSSPESKMLWGFAMVFVIVSTFVISFLGPWLGAILPSDPAQIAPLVLSLWLVVYGGAMFVGGWGGKWPVMTLIGIIWLFSSIHFVSSLSTGPNSYLHFALITALPIILGGIWMKKK